MISRMAALISLLLLISPRLSMAEDPFAPKPQFRVVGYLPNYRAADFDPVAARDLTDLVLFSGEPSPSGTLSLDRVPRIPKEKLSKLFEDRDPETRTRLILCIGGWERSKNFASVANSVERRRRFAVETHQACLDGGYSGVDLDWEHPKTEAEQNGYAAILHDLKTELKRDRITLSLTMAAWQKLPPSVFEEVDSVHIMAYDNQGKHSTFESAKADVKKMLDQGVPAKKIILGVPFYGRDVSKRQEVLTYAEIVAKHKPAPEVDEVGTLYFNGPNTIREKTRFALESKLGGVMFWELGQDAKGKDSLLKVITETVAPQPK